MQVQIESRRLAAKAILKAQRAVAGTWDRHLKARNGDRNAALYSAYRSGGLTMTRLATLTGLTVSHVSRMIAKEGKGKGERGDLSLKPLKPLKPPDPEAS